MKFRRWPHGVISLLALLVGVVILVGLETGASTSPTASRTHAPLPPLGSAQAPAPGYGKGEPGAALPPAKETGGNDDAATGSDGGLVVGGKADPRVRSLSDNPFNFRLGLINGTIVKPDARDYAARTVSTGPLLLFLPATGHVPGDYRSFLGVAARHGYHVLGLDFWNRGKSVAKTCGVDARCYTQVQRNRFNGHFPSQFSRVDEANSVKSRLQAALDYLVEKDPDGGWGRYTHDESILWKNIVVAGHSQGGGESAYIAHRTRVLGQLTFASPIITDRDIAASWLKTKGKTPSSVMYAFDDVHDVYYRRIVNSWRELGIGKKPYTAEIPVPPSGSPHTLLSTMELGRPGQAHLRTVTDGTPRDSDGTPLFEPVWTWMLGQVSKQPTGQSPATDEGRSDKG